MNSFRARLFSSVLRVLLASAAAVQPAIAQTTPRIGAPTPVPSKKTHQKIPPGKDCSNCHKGLYAEWNAGPHGVNQVNCTVCINNYPEKTAPRGQWQITPRLALLRRS